MCSLKSNWNGFWENPILWFSGNHKSFSVLSWFWCNLTLINHQRPWTLIHRVKRPHTRQWFSGLFKIRFYRLSAIVLALPLPLLPNEYSTQCTKAAGVISQRENGKTSYSSTCEISKAWVREKEYLRSMWSKESVSEAGYFCCHCFQHINELLH